MTKQLPAPLAPPKQLQASGEVPVTPVNRSWQEKSCAGLLPICRATAHVHGLVRSCCRDLPGVAWHALQVRCIPNSVAFLHSRA